MKKMISISTIGIALILGCGGSNNSTPTAQGETNLTQDSYQTDNNESATVETHKEPQPEIGLNLGTINYIIPDTNVSIDVLNADGTFLVTLPGVPIDQITGDGPFNIEYSVDGENFSPDNNVSVAEGDHTLYVQVTETGSTENNESETIEVPFTVNVVDEPETPDIPDESNTSDESDEDNTSEPTEPEVVDKTAPTITAPADVTITAGDTLNTENFVATATDNVDSNPVVTTTITDANGNFYTDVNQIDTSVPTTITVSYIAVDASGNSANDTQIIHINEAPDTIAPTITLLGDANTTVAFGGEFVESGVNATDNKDGNITENVDIIIYDKDGNQVESIDTTKPGTHTITYNVTDKAGNQAEQVTRTVIVLEKPDTTKPVITLNGASTITLTEGETFTDPGVNATDNEDGDISSRVGSNGAQVDTSKAGTYTVKYNVTDEAGNKADTVTRTVIVKEKVDNPLEVDTSNANISLNGNTVTITGVDVSDIDPEDQSKTIRVQPWTPGQTSDASDAVVVPLSQFNGSLTFDISERVAEIQNGYGDTPVLIRVSIGYDGGTLTSYNLGSVLVEGKEKETNSPTVFNILKYYGGPEVGLNINVSDSDGIKEVKVTYSGDWGSDSQTYYRGNIGNHGTASPGTSYTITVTDNKNQKKTRSGTL